MRPLLLLQRMGKGLPLSVLITGEYGCCVPGMIGLLLVNWLQPGAGVDPAAAQAMLAQGVVLKDGPTGTTWEVAA